MSDCGHNCNSCGESCSQRINPEDLIEKPHKDSHIKRVIGIVSGKGGVGKSLVSCMLAKEYREKGYKTAILDGDITGPSVPKALGLNEEAVSNGEALIPVATRTGIDVMSVNLLLENETDPVVWRGPVISGAVKQFWSEVIWGDVDTMFIDMPPGTGDVTLTVFQQLPLDGIIIVTSPQDLVSMIVGKAVKMAEIMNIPILGIVENFSYMKCPHCGERIDVFGESKLESIAEGYGLSILGRIPIDPEIAKLVDAGKIEDIPDKYLEDAVSAVCAV